MDTNMSGSLAIRLEGDEPLFVRLRADDEKRLADLLAGGQATISLHRGDADTEGHGALAEVIVDVEGHAFALRLGSPADAAALRRRLALGAVAATLAVAGAGAAIIGADTLNKSAAPQAVSPAAAPAPLEDLSIRRENRLAPMESVGGPAAGGVPADQPGGSGPEFDRIRGGPTEVDR